MPELEPMLIAVAPNGARYNKTDHSALPISPGELARTARTCLTAGASMIHLHVRDAHGRHSIASSHYVPAIEAIRAEVGTEMIIQVTSEAAGVFNRHQQIQAMTELMPESVSIALRELIPDPAADAEARDFLTQLEDAGTLIQYILYDPDELDRYRQLCRRGIIPGQRHLLLFVLGRYSETLAQPGDLDAFVAEHSGNAAWMCCAFGINEQAIMARAAQLGGHARVGFENNMQLPDGTTVVDNSDLVRHTADSCLQHGRRPATATQGRALFESGKS